MRDVLGIAVAIVVALLSQIVQPWSGLWWAGMIVSGTIAAAVAVHLIWRWWCSNQKEPVAMTITPGDVAFNGSMLAATIAVLAAFWGKKKIVLVAVVLAWGAVGFDLWYGPTRGFIWTNPPALTGPDLLRAGLQGNPMGWSQLYINNTTLYDAEKPLRIDNISIIGGNVGDEEIKLDDAYFLSGINGRRLTGKVGWGGSRYSIKDINVIPPGAFIFFLSDQLGQQQKGLTESEFLKEWAIVYFVAEYNGKKQRITFDRESVKKMMPQPIVPTPHITPRQ